jgi:hypothetical protein
MANERIKISQLTPKGANLDATDLLEISEFNGSGYVTKSITGQEIIDAAAGGGVTNITVNAPLSTTGGITPDLAISEADASTDGFITAVDWNTFNDKQDELISGTNIKTINGSSVLGSGDLVVSATANPSVIVLNATDGTAVTGTITDTISRSLLIPANTFTSSGMLEVVARVLKTGAAGAQTFRIYKNTTNSLTGATLIGLILSGSTQIYAQGIRTFRINSNTLTGLTTSTATAVDYATNGNPEVSTTFTTSVDNYIIFAIQLVNSGDSSVVRMARATKYI